jgi:hypothetical protein
MTMLWNVMLAKTMRNTAGEEGRWVWKILENSRRLLTWVGPRLQRWLVEEGQLQEECRELLGGR